MAWLDPGRTENGEGRGIPLNTEAVLALKAVHGTSLQELMELGGWKSYEMVLRYAHLAPEHLADAAARIERRLSIVTEGVTNRLR